MTIETDPQEPVVLAPVTVPEAGLGGHDDEDALSAAPPTTARRPLVQTAKELAVRYLPVIGWAKTYERAWLRDDLVSGLVVGGIMIPVAMAYAQMAGVPPQAGLYSAIVGMTAYALFATSRHLRITASSTISIMSLAVVAPLAGGNAATFLALSLGLAITVGVLMLVLSLLKLGFISDYLSKSVMTG